MHSCPYENHLLLLQKKHSKNIPFLQVLAFDTYYCIYVCLRHYWSILHLVALPTLRQLPKLKLNCSKTNCGDISKLDEIGDVHGHFVDLGVVEFLNLSEELGVFLCDEINGNTFTTKTTTTTDTMKIVLQVVGEIVVNNE